MEKIFELGLVLGRFQTFHKGHKQLIDVTRNLCKKTLMKSISVFTLCILHEWR